MGMSDLYGPADEAESIATIHAAIDVGVTLLDTGDYYAAGHNEFLITGRLANDLGIGRCDANRRGASGIGGRRHSVR